MEPKATDLAWSGVLYCVYTRVSLWDEQSILAYKRSGIKLPTKAARLISSSNEDYPKLYAEKTFENLAMKAFNDICLLDTGARDCDQVKSLTPFSPHVTPHFPWISPAVFLSEGKPHTPIFPMCHTPHFSYASPVSHPILLVDFTCRRPRASKATSRCCRSSRGAPSSQAPAGTTH